MDKKIKWMVYMPDGIPIDEAWIESHTPREILDIISDLIARNKEDIERERSIGEMYAFSQKQLLRQM